MAQNMGLGAIGTNPSLVFKRKYRWTFAIKRQCATGGNQSIPTSFVKLAARPNIEIEETEINYIHGKTWLPGKGTWQAVNVTYYDVNDAPGMSALFSWLASVYEFTNPTSLRQASKLSDYAANGTLQLFDGTGTMMETWNMNNMFPTSINWGDLDYASSDECNIELTLRYSEVQYIKGCGGATISGCFTPCQ